jgi:hypothetical protein
MKTKIIVSVICLFCICSSFTPAKKIHLKETVSKKNVITASNFEFFRTHRQGRAGITSTWGITAPGNDVAGFLVEKTYEDPADPYASWELVSSMPNSGSRSCKCTDNNVFPGYISYRITAILITGGSYTSPVSTVHIVSH